MRTQKEIRASDNQWKATSERRPEQWVIDQVLMTVDSNRVVPYNELSIQVPNSANFAYTKTKKYILYKILKDIYIYTYV